MRRYERLRKLLAKPDDEMLFLSPLVLYRLVMIVFIFTVVRRWILGPVTIEEDLY